MLEFGFHFQQYKSNKRIDLHSASDKYCPAATFSHFNVHSCLSFKKQLFGMNCNAYQRMDWSTPFPQYPYVFSTQPYYIPTFNSTQSPIQNNMFGQPQDSHFANYPVRGTTYWTSYTADLWRYWYQNLFRGYIIQCTSRQFYDGISLTVLRRLSIVLYKHLVCRIARCSTALLHLEYPRKSAVLVSLLNVVNGGGVIVWTAG